MALVAVLVIFGAVTSRVAGSVEGSTTPVRIAVAIGLLFPPGFLMGMAFPLGMKVAAADAPHLTPWLWGINGATSVLASVLSVVIALTWSISTAFWTGVACYVIATALFIQAARGGLKASRKIQAALFECPNLSDVDGGIGAHIDAPESCGARRDVDVDRLPLRKHLDDVRGTAVEVEG